MYSKDQICILGKLEIKGLSTSLARTQKDLPDLSGFQILHIF
jgi:hypothetical protein